VKSCSLDLGAAAVELTPDDLREIGASAGIAGQGARYPEPFERMTGR
jgi:hypothetical protein